MYMHANIDIALLLYFSKLIISKLINNNTLVYWIAYHAQLVLIIAYAFLLYTVFIYCSL